MGVQSSAFSMRATSSAAKLTVLTTLKLAKLGVNVGIVLGTTLVREGTAQAQLRWGARVILSSAAAATLQVSVHMVPCPSSFTCFKCLCCCDWVSLLPFSADLRNASGWNGLSVSSSVEAKIALHGSDDCDRF